MIWNRCANPWPGGIKALIYRWKYFIKPADISAFKLFAIGRLSEFRSFRLVKNFLLPVFIIDALDFSAALWNNGNCQRITFHQ